VVVEVEEARDTIVGEGGGGFERIGGV